MEILGLYQAGEAHGSETQMIYDTNGNLTRNREDVRMAYDAYNRLVKVSVSAVTVAEYVYDADNRRMEKVVTNGGVSNAPSLNGTTRYYYQGWRVLEEHDGSDNLQRQYTYGNYLDEVWTIDDRSGAISVDDLNDSLGSQRHFAHCNTLYHVYGLTDEEKTLVEAYEYDAYGKATVFTDGNANGKVDFDGTDNSQNGSSVANPYQYTGQRYDPETELMYYKNRYYDTDLGRFISRDPLDYVDGMSLYEYVRSRPVVNLDPRGMECDLSGFVDCLGTVLTDATYIGGCMTVCGLCGTVPTLLTCGICAACVGAPLAGCMADQCPPPPPSFFAAPRPPAPPIAPPKYIPTPRDCRDFDKPAGFGDGGGGGFGGGGAGFDFGFGGGGASGGWCDDGSDPPCEK